MLAPRCGVATTAGISSSGLPVAGSAANTSMAAPADPALAQRQRQRLLVHDAAPGCVHDAHARLDQVQFLVAEEADRLGVLRQVDGDEVRLAQQFVQAGQPHAELGRPGRGHVGVVGDDPHAERAQPLGHQDADPAQPEDAGHLAVEFDPGEADRFHSPARSEAAACGTLRATASSSPTACSAALTMLEVGAFTDHHARPGRGLHVHVVQADPGAGYHLQARGMGQRFRIDRGGAAHDDRDGVGERGEQRRPVRAIRVADVEVGFQLRDGGRRKFLGDEDDGCRHGDGPS